MKRNLVFATAVLLLALGSVPMWSQMTQVEGVITDGGKPLPNTVVNFTNVGTNRTYKIKTDKNGKFSMLGVIIGDYQVEVVSSTGDNLFKQKITIAPSESSGLAEVKID